MSAVHSLRRHGVRSAEADKKDASSYAYQQHEIFSIGYYMGCSYDDALSSYHFCCDNDYVAWFVRQLNDLTHRAKNLVSANVPIEALSKEQWEAYRSVYSTLYLREIIRSPRSLPHRVIPRSNACKL